MERNAHYALVGALSILLCLSLVGFVIWLAGAQLSQRFDTYVVAFTGPVRGLSTGGEVFFNGIRVGEVTKLSLDRDNPDKVKAQIRIEADTPVRTNSTAGLEPQGVTGVNYIQITAGTLKASLLKETTPLGHMPVILATVSPLESLLQGGGDVLTRSVEVLDRTNRLMSDDNLSEATSAMRDIHGVTRAAYEQRRVFADLDASAKSVDRAAAQIRTLASTTTNLMDGQGRRAVTEFADAAVQLKIAAADAQEMLTALKAPTGELATRGLPQLETAAAHLQVAVDSINRLSTQIELNPSAMLAKAPAETLKVRP
jgi:phospholipid/cholesterol/gamma-HCH transport system substrate-binding protein